MTDWRDCGLCCNGLVRGIFFSVLVAIKDVSIGRTSSECFHSVILIYRNTSRDENICECNRNYFMRQIFGSIIRYNCLRLKEHALIRSRDDSTLSIGFLRHVLVSTMAFSGLRNYSNHARENQLGTWLYATRLPNVNPVFRPCVRNCGYHRGYEIKKIRKMPWKIIVK